MGLLVDLFKPEPTRAEKERKQKKKLAAEVESLEDIRRSLQLAKNTPYKSVKQGPAMERTYVVPLEDQRKHESLLDQLIKKTDSMVYVHYNTDKIFSLADDLIEILKKAKKSGSTETINRCIIALNYALSEGLAAVPKNRNDEEIKKQREDILSAYYQVCNESMVQDNLRTAIEEKEKEKVKKEKELKDAVDDLDMFASTHYAAFQKVKALTPDQRSKLTGTESQIAAKMGNATDRNVELVHIQQRIGQINLDLRNVEHSCNNLFNIIKDLQISVKEEDVQEINRLTREWEKTVRKEQENIGKLREAANEMDIAFDVIYNNRETKEAIIAINDEYENMLYERRVQEAEDKAGAQLYKAEQEAQRKAIEERVLNEMASNMPEQNVDLSNDTEDNENDESMLLL